MKKKGCDIFVVERFNVMWYGSDNSSEMPITNKETQSFSY